MLVRSKGIGITLIVLGGFFLLTHLFNLSTGSFAWTLFIIIPGLIMIAAAFMADESATGLITPGSIITTVGLILLWQTIAGNFETWSYAWGLILAAAGLGIALQGYLTDDLKLIYAGRQLAIVGLIFFIAFGVFFEMFIFRNIFTGVVGRYVLPVVLILAGLYLLFLYQTRNTEHTAPDRPKSPPKVQT